MSPKPVTTQMLDSTVSPEELNVLLALNDKFDYLDDRTLPLREQIYEYARRLDQSGVAYYPYAVADGLSLDYSMFKYVTTLLFSDADANKLHDLMLSPLGITSICMESVFLIGFSLLSCHFSRTAGDDKTKRAIANAWPYVRDVLKGFKNSYNGLSGTLKLAANLGAHGTIPLLLPLGLTLGALAAVNRVWIRNMRAERKSFSDKNKKYLEALEAAEITEKNIAHYSNQIERQRLSVRFQSYGFVACNALIDSMYLYIGVLTVASLSAVVLWPLAILTAGYVLACVATRLYEEYGYQQKHLKTEVQCEMAIYRKALLKAYADDDLEAVKHWWRNLQEKNRELSELAESSYKLAALMGIRHGLYAYGAVNSVLFAVAAVLLLCQVAFPPALIIAASLSGLVFIVGFVMHALVVEYAKQHKKTANADEELIKAITPEQLEQWMQDKLTPAQIDNRIREGLFLDPSPQFFFQEWFEVIRSFFSGLGKGRRNIDFAFNPLKQADEQGDYHDTTVMFVLMGVNALIFAAILALRAFASSFGKNGPKVDKKEAPKVNDEAFPPSLLAEPVEQSEDENIDEPAPPVWKAANPPNQKRSPSVTLGFFKPSHEAPVDSPVLKQGLSASY